MPNQLHIWTKKSLTIASLLCLTHLLFFTAFSQGNPAGTGQQTQVTESRSGANNEYHEITTRYPDGSSETIKYLVKTIDGKPFEVKIGHHKQTRDRETGIQISQDTSYWNDGITLREITDMRYKPGGGDTIVLMESSKFDKMGNQESGWKKELGLDLRLRDYKWNPKTQEYELTATYGEGVKPISCPAPKSFLSGSVAFTKKEEEGFGKLNYIGGAVNYSHYFGDGYNVNDSVYNFCGSMRTQVGIGVGGIFVFASDEDFKFNLGTLTAGPEIRFTKNIFSGALQLQGGVAREGFKYGDIKEHETSFAVKGGLVLDVFVTKRLAIEFTPQVVWTNFGGESRHFNLFGLGAGYEIGFAMEAERKKLEAEHKKAARE